MNLLMGDKNELTLKKEEYKYVVPVDSPIRDVPDILGEEIKEGSVVLDIGCGQGKYAFLIEKGCTLYGIDIEKKAVELAQSKNYADAWCVDIENDEGLDKNPQFQYRYDAIIMQDVLEHVYDPVKVIVRYSRYLKDDGKILVSVPNVAHIDILLHLLNGEFNYGQLGIMDNTHVRFFTKKSFAKMIEAINESGDASLDCRHIDGMFVDSDYCNQYEKKFPKLWRAINGNVRKNGIVNLFVLQEVTQETKKYELDKIIHQKDDAIQRLGELTENTTTSPDNGYIYCINSEREWYEHTIKLLQQLLASERKYNVSVANQIKEMTKEIYKSENGRKAAVAAYEDLKQYTDCEISKKEETAKSMREYVVSLESDRAEKDAQLKSLHEYAVSLESDRAEKDAQLKSLHEYVVSLESDRAEKDTQLKSLYEYAVRLEQTTAGKEKQITEISEQMAAITRERDEVLDSISWRITKPLRAMKNIAKK